MTEPRVGIVILNWNGWQDTVECLTSLKNLDYANFKIYIVDNASTDDSVTQLQARFPDVSLIRSEENGGFAKGNNLGIRQALSDGAEYIWLLNNDTTVSMGAIKAMVSLAESDPNIGIVGAVLYEYNYPGVVQAWGGGKYNKYLATTTTSKDAITEVEHITGASMFIKTSTIGKIGFLSEDFFFYMEDTEYSLRVRLSGLKLRVAQDARVYHKGGSSIKEDYSKPRSLRVDTIYAHAVGTFMRVAKVPRYTPFLRLIAIVLQRIFRGQISRILIVVRCYLYGYFSKGLPDN